jgi:hypothetical protein
VRSNRGGRANGVQSRLGSAGPVRLTGPAPLRRVGVEQGVVGSGAVRETVPRTFDVGDADAGLCRARLSANARSQAAGGIKPLRPHTALDRASGHGRRSQSERGTGARRVLAPPLVRDGARVRNRSVKDCRRLQALRERH